MRRLATGARKWPIYSNYFFFKATYYSVSPVMVDLYQRLVPKVFMHLVSFKQMLNLMKSSSATYNHNEFSGMAFQKTETILRRGLQELQLNLSKADLLMQDKMSLLRGCESFVLTDSTSPLCLLLLLCSIGGMTHGSKRHCYNYRRVQVSTYLLKSQVQPSESNNKCCLQSHHSLIPAQSQKLVQHDKIKCLQASRR